MDQQKSWFRPSRKNPGRPQKVENFLAPILLLHGVAIVGLGEYPGEVEQVPEIVITEGVGIAIKDWMLNSPILLLHGVHEVIEGDAGLQDVEFELGPHYPPLVAKLYVCQTHAITLSVLSLLKG